MIESAQITALTDDPPRSDNQSLAKWIEFIREEKVVPKDFDVVIMNPPFTRRERIPAKTEELERLVPEVKGKTGYWAYFVVAADKLLKEDGTLAMVIPEEFFAGGGAAKSVREYLLHKGYQIKYIVRSTAELAFSESALYRDYLIVLKRARDLKPLTLILLNKKLDEIKGRISEVVENIRGFIASLDSSRHTADFTALKISDEKTLLTKHIGNLKPLVAFNTLETYFLALELLDKLKENPTVKDLEAERKIKIRVYNPGQYKTRGVESFARKLFANRFGSKSPQYRLQH